MAVELKTRNGVRLSYLDKGQGSPSLLLIHGWGGDRRIWQRQIAAFAARHRIVAVDLRGHGGSDAPRQDYSIGALADDVAWLCRRLHLRHVVAVGHRMGGLIALRLTAALKEVTGLVFIGTRLMPPHGMSGQVEALREQLTSTGYQSAVTKFAERLFLSGSSPDLVRWAGRMMADTPRHVLLSTLTALEEEGHRLPSGSLPARSLYVLSSDAPPSLAKDLSDRYPNLAIAQVVEGGQFLQMEAAGQFNSMLRRFLGTFSPPGFDVSKM